MIFPILRVAAAGLVAACLALCPIGHAALAQAYPTMASQPDPTDFVKRADTGLTLLGTRLRFGGADIAWLGLRQDKGAVPRRPTAYELRDAMRTVQALGGTVVRSTTLAGTAGCALCLEPADGQFDDAAFAQLDQALSFATNLGLKLILPLAGGPCPASGSMMASGENAICAFVRWHGGTDPHAFFTDPTIRADFLARVRAILEHVNTLTGVAYRDDPAILAWENCDSCAGDADPQAVSAWTEAVGQVIKTDDRFHLYENGAFAGRILPRSAQAVNETEFAPPSVDIVGDKDLPPGDLADMRTTFASVTGAVGAAGRAYVIDSFDWSPRTWKTQADFQAYLDTAFKQHAVAGALFGGLQSHADQGGYLPAGPPASGDAPALYFPGLPIKGVDKSDMEERGRALRRFDYNMADVLLAPAYLLPPQPEIISASHGRLVWRGAAGALDYTVERSPDAASPDSWSVVCDQCATDGAGFWQDPSPPAGTAWYRIMPFNINGHKAPPSEPVKNR